MMEAFKVIRAVVVYRAPGTCLVAVSRHGKTTAIGRIQEELASAFPNLAIGRVIALSQTSGALSQRTFHGDLLECYRHRRARVGTSADLRKLVLNVWQGECRVKDSDRYLLLVDEAQSWCEECFTWLRDLTNLAQSQGINVITVLFGQPELLQFRDALRTRGRQDIIGRFLLTPREFRGLTSLDDIKQVLQAFDDPARHQYPVGSDICYTEFFMPRAFAAGWRLAFESERLWGALSEVARRQPHRQGGIGMQYVFWSIRSFIFEHLQDDGIGFRGDDPAWLRAVESSELEIALS